MSKDEALALIANREYADPGFPHGWVQSTSRLVRAACDVALLRRKKRTAIPFRSGNNWFWKQNREGN